MKKNMNMEKNANVAFYSSTSATCDLSSIPQILDKLKQNVKNNDRDKREASNRVRKN